MAINNLQSVTVLVVEDDYALREAIVETLGLAKCTVHEAGSAEEACVFLEKQNVDIVFSDVCMGDMDGHALLGWVQRHKPHIPFVLMTAYGTIERSVEAMHSGAADYLVKPFEPRALLDLLDKYAGGTTVDEGPVIGDEKTQAVYDIARRVAQTESTVLISGESGTGKEVLSRFIHSHSACHNGPFVAINCAAIPESMLEATLFGHEKGAFTGAYSAAPGKFELANGGTLLLDEVSEMELGLQAKLLRVLQEREVERVGGRKTIPLEVRVLATTNRNLRAHVEAGKFREDLFYRLSVFPLHLPALVERQGDVLPLAQHLLDHHAARMHRKGVEFSKEAQEKLLAYHWPGNVRELDNVVQRALIMCTGQLIATADLLFDSPVTGANATPPMQEVDVQDVDASRVTAEQVGDDSEVSAVVGELSDDLKRHELQKILRALDKTKGSKKEAAELLGLSPRTLRYKMAKFRESGLLDEL